jgi:oligopeptide/dipeptide ABC transporter ATP-binding protein
LSSEPDITSISEPEEGGPPLLEVSELLRHFHVRQKGGLWGRKAVIKAVDGVSFAINKGDTFGIVGESGCGKSTTARLLLNMDKPTSGSITFKNQKILSLSPALWRKLRQQMQYVFQDPLGALDPRMKIIEQVAEPLRIHNRYSKSESHEKAAEILRDVDLSNHTFRRYPHELSGGQRQRVVLARALILEPELLVCDEPVSALDVSIQAQVINLLVGLRKQMGLTIIFISHDLSIVSHACERVAVMYLGKIIEIAQSDLLFQNPANPYTQALLSAIPIPQPGLHRERIFLKGDPPSPVDPPSGCRFHTRCPFMRPVCAQIEPKLKTLQAGQSVACHVAHGDA